MGGEAGLKTTTAAGPRGIASPAVAAPADARLFDRLRSLRKALADERGVPAYVVFHDTTLREMAERRPRDRGQMLEVAGVGPVKFERYGAAFLDVLKDG